MSLEGGRPQKTGQQGYRWWGRGEAPKATGARKRRRRRTETSAQGSERPDGKVVERQQRQAALKRVRKNKGSPGIDGMTVDELPALSASSTGSELREQLLAGTYQPHAGEPAVRFPKPTG